MLPLVKKTKSFMFKVLIFINAYVAGARCLIRLKLLDVGFG